MANEHEAEAEVQEGPPAILVDECDWHYRPSHVGYSHIEGANLGIDASLGEDLRGEHVDHAHPAQLVEELED